MKLVADHGWPIASDGSDGRGLEAFKNERDYIAQNGRLKTVVAAMDWATREIMSLRARLIQVREVCDDNAAASCNQAMALAFVRSIADRAVGQSASDGEKQV